MKLEKNDLVLIKVKFIAILSVVNTPPLEADIKNSASTVQLYPEHCKIAS